MKYYKNSDNQVFAYENDGSQDDFIPDSLIQISNDEAIELTKPHISIEDLILKNEKIKTELITDANNQINLLQDIIELNMQESNEDEQLKAWKKYRILLTRLDTNNIEITWPEKPQ